LKQKEPTSVHTLLDQSAPATRWRPWVALSLLLSYFVMFGISFGSQGVIWNDLIRALELSKGMFGTAQLASPLVSVFLLAQSGALCAWAGTKRLTIVGGALLGSAILLLSLATSLWALVAALMLAGAGFGLVELAMNAATLDWERITGRKVMNVLHACFSGGAVLGALLGGALLGAGWAYPAILQLVAALWYCDAALTLLVRFPASAPPHDGEAPSHALRLLFSREVFVILAVMCAISTLGESIANTWSVIYFADLGASSLVGSAAFALFNGTMFFGRLANASLVARLGERASLMASGALILLAGLLLIGVPNVPSAVLAFALLGLAVAGAVPTVLSAAAQVAPRQTASITGAMMTAAYVSFIVGPPLIGWLADALALRTAFLLVVVMGAACVLLARRLRLAA
jgi:MFS family permease